MEDVGMLIPAKCTQCGSNLTVDSSQDAAVCPFCNTPFVAEKAINNYNTTNNIKADVVNVFQTKESEFIIRGGVLEKYIGENTEVYIPSSVVRVNEAAFKDCYGITKVVFPNSVNFIGDCVFSNCTSLETVFLPEGLEKISLGLFSGCKQLKNVNIPRSVKSIEGSAFQHCESLSDISLSDKISEIGGSAFLNCKKLKNIIVPEGVKSIHSKTFANCSSMESVVLPNTLEEIENEAFKDCISLHNINIPKSVKKIAYNYYDSLYELQEYAPFENCKNLRTINGKTDPFEDLFGIAIKESFVGTPLFEVFHKHLVFVAKGRCRWCGGKFKGVMTKVCSVCNRKKDYR